MTNREQCEKLCNASNSNLWIASRNLGDLRQRCFAAFYASFRILDDFAETQQGEGEIDLWLELCGLAYSNDNLVCSSVWSKYDYVFKELKIAFKSCDIDFRYWQDIAIAMKTDASTTSNIFSMEDFKKYCVGATQAPATVFLYLLASKKSKRQDKPYLKISVLAHKLIQDASSKSSIFCYLIHIIRDLISDASKSTNLLVIPDILLNNYDLSKNDLHDYAVKVITGDQIASEVKENVKKLVIALLELAHSYKIASIETMSEIPTLMKPKKVKLLVGLMNVYSTLYNRILANPDLAYAPPNKLPILSDSERFEIINWVHIKPSSSEEFAQEISHIIKDGLNLIFKSAHLLPKLKDILQEELPYQLFTRNKHISNVFEIYQNSKNQK